MIRRFAFFVVLAAAAFSPAAVSAQAGAKPQVPAAYLPPKGMCRIWLDGVAADKQPAATDCPTALKNKPATGQVIFSADEPTRPVQNNALRQQSLMPPVNGFSSSRGVPTLVRPPVSAAARDSAKAKADSLLKARRDTLPKKPPPPSP